MDTNVPKVFDRRLLRIRRDLLARRRESEPAGADFLFREVAEQFGERLRDIRRHFPLALDLGARDGLLRAAIGEAGGIERIVHCDASPSFLRRVGAGLLVVGDEEYLPFRGETFDLVLSNLNLHWVNDLPGTLAQIRAILKPDGFFLAAMLGAGTLAELRQALIEAESAETGGASLRVSPFADLRDAAGLLQRAGFALPVADRIAVRATYADAFALWRDLRAMGENAAPVAASRRPANRAIFARAAAIYADRFADKDGRIPASFEVIFLAGWAPHPSQQKPARRGSAQIGLGQVLGENDRR